MLPNLRQSARKELAAAAEQYPESIRAEVTGLLADANEAISAAENGCAVAEAADRFYAAVADAAIAAIGTVTKDSKAAITAARTLYDGLTDAQRDILSSGITVITDDIAAPDEAPADELDGADDSMDGFWVQYGYAIVVMMLCMMSTAFLLRAVVEEKESKLVELLMVSVSPLALLGGKILAVMLYVAALLLLVLFGMGGSVLLAGLLFGPGTGAEALSAVLPYLTGADGGILHAVGTVLVVLVSLLLALTAVILGIVRRTSARPTARCCSS